MTDELDPTERRIARRLADFAETPFPARTALDHVVVRAVAAGDAKVTRNRLGALLAAALAAVLAIGTLSRFDLVQPAATADPTPTPEVTPHGVGMLHLTADPGYDLHDPLRVGYVLPDGRTAPEFDAFEAETTIFLDRSLPAGSITILANDMVCAPRVPIEANVEVDAVLSVEDDRCAISVAGSHALGAIVHPEPRTALGAFVVIDSVLVVTPLDPGSTMAPIRRPSDERAEVQDFDIPPGRYELAIVVDGVVQSTLEIDIKRGQQFYYNVRGLPADVPRDCGTVPVELCETAILGAYRNGFFPTPAAVRIAMVRVRPAATSGCYEPPAFDVYFEVRDEPRTVELTVGRVPDGRYLVCTY
jgi:hypothetical protein